MSQQLKMMRKIAWKLNQAPPTTTMKSFKDAIVALEDIQNFLEGRGHLAASLTYIGPAVDAVAALQIASVRQ